MLRVGERRKTNCDLEPCPRCGVAGVWGMWLRTKVDSAFQLGNVNLFLSPMSTQVPPTTLREF